MADVFRSLARWVKLSALVSILLIVVGVTTNIVYIKLSWAANTSGSPLTLITRAASIFLFLIHFVVIFFFFRFSKRTLSALETYSAETLKQALNNLLAGFIVGFTVNAIASAIDGYILYGYISKMLK